MISESLKQKSTFLTKIILLLYKKYCIGDDDLDLVIHIPKWNINFIWYIPIHNKHGVKNKLLSGISKIFKNW